MAYVSHSVADTSYNTIRKTFTNTVDLFGNPLKTSKVKFYQHDWPSITSSSKVGDFKLQDLLRTYGDGSQIKNDYYSQSKMTFAEAETKAAQTHLSMSVTMSRRSGIGLGGYVSKTQGTSVLGGWSTACSSGTGTRVGSEQLIIRHSKEGSNWKCARAFLSFHMNEKWRDTRHFTKATLRVYTSQSTCDIADANGLRVKPFLWPPSTMAAFTDADYDSFNTDYQSTTITVLSGSGDADEYAEIEIDGTLLDWMNANPDGQANYSIPDGDDGLFGICLRGAYDYGEDGTNGTDPTGKNEMQFVTVTDPDKAPELYIEFTSSQVPRIGNLSDGSGEHLSGTASVSIGGVHTSSIGGLSPQATAGGKWKVNHNPKDKYHNNFLTGTGESEWQFCYSQSYKANGNKIDDHNSELTLVGKNTGINFKVKKSSVDFLGNVVNFKKKN